jgi:hypothetical protein
MGCSEALHIGRFTTSELAFWVGAIYNGHPEIDSSVVL